MPVHSIQKLQSHLGATVQPQNLPRTHSSTWQYGYMHEKLPPCTGMTCQQVQAGSEEKVNESE